MSALNAFPEVVEKGVNAEDLSTGAASQRLERPAAESVCREDADDEIISALNFPAPIGMVFSEHRYLFGDD